MPLASPTNAPVFMPVHNPSQAKTNAESAAPPATAGYVGYIGPFPRVVAAVSRTSAQARCCTSDLTLAEFKTLRGKMDGANYQATTAAAYQDGTSKTRTDMYAAGSHGKLVTHKESIALIQKWGRKATPELKTYTKGAGMLEYNAVRAKVVQEYKDASFSAENVWLQSFNVADIKW